MKLTGMKMNLGMMMNHSLKLMLHKMNHKVIHMMIRMMNHRMSMVKLECSLMSRVMLIGKVMMSRVMMSMGWMSRGLKKRLRKVMKRQRMGLKMLHLSRVRKQRMGLRRMDSFLKLVRNLVKHKLDWHSYRNQNKLMDKRDNHIQLEHRRWNQGNQGRLELVLAQG